MTDVCWDAEMLLFERMTKVNLPIYLTRRHSVERKKKEEKKEEKKLCRPPGNPREVDARRRAPVE